MIWKPSLKTPLCAIAVHKLMEQVLAEHGHPGVMGLIIGSDAEVGERLIADPRIPLISATGSCRMGERVGQVVAKRFGRSLLELGGNNALIVMADANMELALRAVVFGAVGTAGQRCTSTRRLFVQRPAYDAFVSRLKQAYTQVRIGDPPRQRHFDGAAHRCRGRWPDAPGPRQGARPGRTRSVRRRAP